MSQFPFISVEGTPRDRGKQYGIAAAERVHRSARFYSEQLDRLGIPDDRKKILIGESAEQIAAFEPIYIEEMRGIAAGADISFESIVVINARTEIISAARRMAGNTPTEEELNADGCTGAVILPPRSENGALIQGQNWDWQPECVDTAIIIRVKRDEGPTVLTFVEAGGLGRHGLNSAGVGVTGNYLQSDRDYKGTGVPLSLVRRRALDQSDVALAMSYIATTPKVCSTNMIVTASAGWAIDYECAPDEAFPLYPSNNLIVHANHWVSPVALAKLKDTGLTSTADSQYRDWRVRNILEAIDRPLTREDLKTALFDDFLSPYSVCRPIRAGKNSDRSASVAMIVMEPGNGLMEVAPLPAENRIFTRYSLTEDPVLLS